MRFLCLCLVAVLLLCTDVNAQTANEFERMVAEQGLDKGMEDLSNEGSIVMPEPRFAYVNLTGVSALPTNKAAVKRGWMEVYDGNGRYFKKPVTIAGQGNYSLRYPKKNFVCHFCDSLWNEDEGADFQIGDWVKQDAFHFKAFYTDFLRGIGEVGYKVFEKIVDDRLPYWERGGYHKESQAKCFPDGFPCAVYLDGKFHGVYAWQLKKHHKNMNQKKSEATHIHLDGNLQDQFIFRGKTKWRRFEVRNPKGLYAMDGEVYDGNSPRELLDEGCAAFDDKTDSEEVKAAKVRTCEVKRSILKLSKYWDELDSMRNAGMDELKLKKEIEKRYDIESLIDYHVFFFLSANCDGTLKNWQWFTYDGRKWFVTPYDLDQTFGINLYGVVRPATLGLAELTSGPFYWVNLYYQDEIRERYALLRGNGAISPESIIGIVDDWYGRVGDEFYGMEKGLWGNSPCYRDAVCNAGWEVSDDWEKYSTTADYGSTIFYQAGDLCKLEGRLWKATRAIHGVKPFTVNANTDSIDRLREWVKERIDYLDAAWDYKPETNDITQTRQSDAPRRLMGIFTLSGMQVAYPEKGVNIYKYSDGTTLKVIKK